MKTILINGITLAKKEIYGVQRTTTELLCELDRFIEPGRVKLVIPEKGERSFAFENIELLRVPVDCDSRQAMREWNFRGFNATVRRERAIGVDTILGVPLGGCALVAVYDCTTEICVQNADTLRRKIGRRLYMLRVKDCLKKARVVMTDSESAKADIMRYYGIDGGKIRVVTCAWQHFARVSEDAAVLERLGLREKGFFFALGSRYYHKNHRWVVAAARQNPDKMFVVSGGGSVASAADEAVPDNLIYAGYLSDGEVKALMRRCIAFLQPSLYEGFGIPPMEAMSAGARCIVSDIPALREIYGDSVWYIDPRQYEGIDFDAIMSKPIADNQKVLDAYSWEKSARRFKELLDLLQKESC